MNDVFFLAILDPMTDFTPTLRVPHWSLSPRSGGAFWLASPDAVLLAAVPAARLDAALMSVALSPCPRAGRGLVLSRISSAAAAPVFVLAFAKGACAESFFEALGHWSEGLALDAPRCRRGIPDAADRLRAALAAIGDAAPSNALSGRSELSLRAERRPAHSALFVL